MEKDTLFSLQLQSMSVKTRGKNSQDTKTSVLNGDLISNANSDGELAPFSARDLKLQRKILRSAGSGCYFIN